MLQLASRILLKSSSFLAAQSAAYECDRAKLPPDQLPVIPPRPEEEEEGPSGAAAPQGGKQPAGTEALPEGEEGPAELPRVHPGGGHRGEIAALMGSAPGQVNKRPRAGDDDGNGGTCGEEKNAEAAASMGPAGHNRMRALGGGRPAA